MLFTYKSTCGSYYTFHRCTCIHHPNMKCRIYGKCLYLHLSHHGCQGNKWLPWQQSRIFFQCVNDMQHTLTRGVSAASISISSAWGNLIHGEGIHADFVSPLEKAQSQLLLPAVDEFCRNKLSLPLRHWNLWQFLANFSLQWSVQHILLEIQPKLCTVKDASELHVAVSTDIICQNTMPLPQNINNKYTVLTLQANTEAELCPDSSSIRGLYVYVKRG